MKSGKIFLTLPNIITSIRLFLSLPLVVLILNNKFVLAAILVFVSFVSDVLDGFLARRLKMESFTGAFLDTFADKIFIFLIFLSLLSINKFPLWLFLVILSRDLGIALGWLILTLSKKEKGVIPRLTGKITLFIQMFTMLSVLLELRYLEVIYVVCAILTIISGIDYLLNLRIVSLILKKTHD